MTQETVTNRLENIGDKITNTEEKNGREKVEQKSKRHEKQQIIEGHPSFDASAVKSGTRACFESGKLAKKLPELLLTRR
ncbi:hypothetical protein V1477_010214 [Vespula maculifrons]|uniref:Uncharacterized protein n=1 Tax=Vespula maculifrons TaxID=7453 RepID=A0ABD2CA19_VESMC